MGYFRFGFCALLGVLGSLVTGSAQDVQHRLEATYGRGRILDIYPNFPDRSTWHSAQFAWLASGLVPKDDAWYVKPEYGVRIGYFHLGNDRVLGHAWSVQPEFRMYRSWGKSLGWYGSFGFGYLWFSKAFDELDNPENIMAGSHSSFIVTGKTGLRWLLNERWYGQAGFAFWHSSNAHSKLPNVGMNVPALEVGLGYRIGPAPSTEKVERPVLPDSLRRWRPVVRFFFGLNEFGTTTQPTNGEKYEHYGISAGVNYRLSPCNQVGIHLDHYYNHGYYTYQLAQEIPDLEASYTNASVWMLMVGHEFLFWRLGFLTQFGVNLHNPTLQYLLDLEEDITTMDQIKQYVPGRMVLTFYPAGSYKHVVSPFVNIGVKTNLGQADFLEMGLGFSW